MKFSKLIVASFFLTSAAFAKNTVHTCNGYVYDEAADAVRSATIRFAHGRLNGQSREVARVEFTSLDLRTRYEYGIAACDTVSEDVVHCEGEANLPEAQLPPMISFRREANVLRFAGFRAKLNCTAQPETSQGEEVKVTKVPKHRNEEIIATVSATMDSDRQLSGCSLRFIGFKDGKNVDNFDANTCKVVSQNGGKVTVEVKGLTGSRFDPNARYFVERVTLRTVGGTSFFNGWAFDGF